MNAKQASGSGLMRWLAGGVLAGSLLAGSGAALAAETLSPAEREQVKAAERQRIQAISSVYGAVVAIYGNDRAGGGSGVLYDPAGFALTNHHVVAAAGVEGWAGLADGKLYRWKLIGSDPGGDVAIIQLAGQDRFPVAPLGNSETVRVGDFAMAMGNPFVLAEDQRPTVTLGIVSGVHRYQPGQGMNQLVYGNCIQVDSSINPGNSGGPLFNLRGEVIGINGRGSFEERGRVNVGLGYAISSNQVKHFIPELLATKIVQHGTLDALFGNRGGEVVCHTLNLDAPLARAGLQLGDKLVAFEGVPIVDANQFTNLITTFPAGWPVAVTYQRGDEPQRTANVRLTPLPYEPIVKPGQEPPPADKPAEDKDKPAEDKDKPAEDKDKPAEDKDKPAEDKDKPAEDKDKPAEDKPAEDKPAEDKPAEDKPAEDKPAEDKPAEDKPAAEEPAEPAPEKKPEKPGEDEPDPPMPRPVRVRAPHIPLGDAGKIRNAKLNQEIARLLLARWPAHARAGAAGKRAGVKLVDELRQGDEVVGRQETIVAGDGRCRVQYELGGRTAVVAWDGKAAWTQLDGAAPQSVSSAKALRDPHFAQAAVLTAVLSDRPLAGWGELALDGADKAQGKLCYRFSLTDADGEQLFLWLAPSDRGPLELTLLKSGAGIDDEERIPCVLYDEWQAESGLPLFPRRRTLAKGLAETPELSLAARSVESLAEVPESLFRMPNP